MTVRLKRRADARALAVGLTLGGAIGMGLAACYVAGGIARAADTLPPVARLDPAAAQGFSERAFLAETAGMDPGALALAEQHDPLAMTLAGLRLAPETAENPFASASKKTVLTRAAFITGPAARPFHFADSDALQSARDLECLTDAVYYESRGEPAAGQAAVAQVVLNRVRHPFFPKTVCGVVFQGAAAEGCQFSFACDGSMRRTRDAAAWRRAEQVASRALAGFVMPTVGNATHFHVVGLDPGWGPRLMQVARIGLHVFYRFGGYAGAPSTFNGAARPSGSQDDPTGGIQQASADGHADGRLILASAAVVTPAPPSAGASAPATTAAPKTGEPPALASDSAKPAADTAKANTGL